MPRPESQNQRQNVLSYYIKIYLREPKPESQDQTQSYLDSQCGSIRAREPQRPMQPRQGISTNSKMPQPRRSTQAGEDEHEAKQEKIVVQGKCLGENLMKGAGRKELVFRYLGN